MRRQTKQIRIYVLDFSGLQDFELHFKTKTVPVLSIVVRLLYFGLSHDEPLKIKLDNLNKKRKYKMILFGLILIQ